ncbi:hypothetical protein BXY82_2646 [Gelidibacter sediminis]|uniref:Uncharacterized protein n=1 Tax=Gelidibacter sediminis TaxID=1608710 RepID=A0A4R7PZW0_9FLAO|nr:hypothetical protein BXY82_2646 [Gelidibacter sediminis]
MATCAAIMIDVLALPAYKSSPYARVFPKVPACPPYSRALVFFCTSQSVLPCFVNPKYNASVSKITYRIGGYTAYTFCILCMHSIKHCHKLRPPHIGKPASCIYLHIQIVVVFNPINGVKYARNGCTLINV